MNRRAFLTRFLAPAAAATVIAPLLPSEVFPFRKIFLPLAKPITDFMDSFYGIPTWLSTSGPGYAGPISLANIQAIELETFAKEVPDLLLAPSSIYKHFTASAIIAQQQHAERGFRIPIRLSSHLRDGEAFQVSSEELRLTMDTFHKNLDRHLNEHGFSVCTNINPKKSSITFSSAGSPDESAALEDFSNRSVKIADSIAKMIPDGEVFS